jgi:hypothetical protein
MLLASKIQRKRRCGAELYIVTDFQHSLRHQRALTTRRREALSPEQDTYNDESVPSLFLQHFPRTQDPKVRPAPRTVLQPNDRAAESIPTTLLSPRACANQEHWPMSIEIAVPLIEHAATLRVVARRSALGIPRGERSN